MSRDYALPALLAAERIEGKESSSGLVAVIRKAQKVIKSNPALKRPSEKTMLEDIPTLLEKKN